MNRRAGMLGVVLMLIAFVCSLSVLATDAQMYFSSDKNGQNRVENIQEGDEIWIVIIDNDENIDCDVRDKTWTDIKIMDPKTGAHIVWVSYLNDQGDASGFEIDENSYIPYKGHWPGNNAGWLGGDYLEESGADTGVFVSVRAFQVGTRYRFAAGTPWFQTHVVDVPVAGVVDEFQWGHYLYSDSDFDGHADDRGWFGNTGVGTDPTFNAGRMWGNDEVPVGPDETGIVTDEYLIGRFENMDTLIGMYQDQNDPTDVAVGSMKIIDTEATIAWSQEIYKDANTSAAITVVDPDENLNCNEVEYVPVFILVNPGSWNPVDWSGFDGGRSPTNFCMLKRTGGVNGDGEIGDEPIRWYNIYNADANAAGPIANGEEDGRYYIEYPALADIGAEDNVSFFDTVDTDGVTPVSFYAQETGVNTGVFQLNLNSILVDLEFNSLNVRDVLVAYYLDPNDFDDFKIATAYIEEQQHSITSFTDANRADKDLYWIGRDPVYVQVIDSNANVDPCCPEQILVHICDPHGEDDAEWLFLDETSSNSPVFFTFAGTQLWPTWDGLGVGLADANGGFQLQLDNWKIEAFNEDDIYARYNDVYYVGSTGIAFGGLGNDTRLGLFAIGNSNIGDSWPPFMGLGLPVTSFGPTALLPGARVHNDVSFDMMSVADTQVYDGSSVNMWFLDRQGNRVSGYVNSDCVFVEVLDPDQDEDQYRRERIDAFWDGGQDYPFGPVDLLNNHEPCGFADHDPHDVNQLLGDTNILATADNIEGLAKLYVMNPRNGRWAPVDLLETGPATGDFVSVICIDLTNVYECVPQLGVLPGDTIVAYYQDPSNHSDSAMISIKVGVGGGGTPPSQQSTTMFVDSDGNEVATYSDADDAFVKVVDPSHAGGTLLADAVEIAGVEYDLLPLGFGGDFMTEAIELNLAAGQAVTATYTDPTNSLDTSSDTITIVSSVLSIDSFIAGPNPFEIDVTFFYEGTGVAGVMTLAIYDLSGHLLQELSEPNVSEIVWDGTKGARCSPLANGVYIYVVTATDGTNTFTQTGKVFVNR